MRSSETSRCFVCSQKKDEEEDGDNGENEQVFRPRWFGRLEKAIKISRVQRTDGAFEDLLARRDNPPFHLDPKTSH